MTIEASDPVGMGRSVIPYYQNDTNKARYLSYRVNNFNHMESCQLAGINPVTVQRWRKSDPYFYKLDVEDMGELRKQYSAEFLEAEFTRNFRLVLRKDFEVLNKDARHEILSSSELSYLFKIRAHYTPQQLAMLKQLLGGGTVDKPFDFTKFVLTIRKETESVEIRSE